MGNNVTSTRGIRLKYKDHYVQAVILPDGRKLVITGTSYGAGSPISALSEITVAKKSDLTSLLKQAVNRGYILKDNYNDRHELTSYADLV